MLSAPIIGSIFHHLFTLCYLALSTAIITNARADSMTVLHISSSVNLQKSFSRQIGALVVENILKNSPCAKIITRDLVKNPIPHISPDFLQAMYSDNPDAPELTLSNELIKELFASNIIVIESPMYNFSVSSTLKAWIDHIVRSKLTYQRGEGLVKGKKAILVITRGGFYSEGPKSTMDHQESYLRTILNYIGITTIETIYIEGTVMGEEKVAKALDQAKKRLTEVVNILCPSSF
jgi:FMN-dependent NADH-azoreductase